MAGATRADDVTILEEAVYEFGRAEWRLGYNARGVNFSPADQRDRDAKCAALVRAIRDLAPLLDAATQRNALAGECERLRRAVTLALDGPSDGEVGMETTLGRLHRIERQLRAALAPAAGEGSDLGSQHRAPQSCGGGSE